MDAGTMKDYIEDLIQQSNAAAQVMQQATDEIKRLRKMAHNLYLETKRCGSLHDTPATMDYEEWLEEND